MIVKRFAALVLLISLTVIAYAEVPRLINYQGRVVVSGTNFTGTGLFKFSLVNGGSGQTLWSNGVHSIEVPVSKGLYSVLLGDAGMAPLPVSAFTNSDVRLRVWFDDGGNGLQLFTPDQRIASVGYALMAANVPDGLITSNKLAAGSVGTSQLASNLTVIGTFAGDGAGLTNLSVNGTFTWKVATGIAVQAAANTGCLCTNNDQVTITLPPAPLVGDTVRVSGPGSGGWKIAQNDGQRILASSVLSMSPLVTWTACESNRNWECIACSADGRYLTAVASGGQIHTSADYGETWTARENNRSWVYNAMSADGKKQVALDYGGHIYCSTDAGVTWMPRASMQNWRGVACSSDGTVMVAGVQYGYVWTSIDSGLTWTQHTALGSARWHVAATSADGVTLYVGAYTDGALYKSIDSGVTWTSIRSADWYRGLACSADGRKLVLVGWYTPIYVSSDGGTTWAARESSRNWVGAASSADGTKLIVAAVENSPFYTSTDSGATWTARESIQNGCHWPACSADGTRAAIVKSGGQIYVSRPSQVQPDTTTTAGTSGYLVGGQNSSIELQYIGNGQFLPLNHTGSIFGY